MSEAMKTRVMPKRTGYFSKAFTGDNGYVDGYVILKGEAYAVVVFDRGFIEAYPIRDLEPEPLTQEVSK